MPEPAADTIVIAELAIQSDAKATTSINSEVTSPSAFDHKLAVAATWFAFLVFGLGDGASGAVLIYMQAQYEISYLLVSLIFLVQIAGYGSMSFSASYLVRLFGRRYFSLLGSACGTIGWAMIICGPPFPVVVVAYLLIGFAAGIFEAMLNAYVGIFKESVTILGCLHGFYGLGCTISPIIATQMIVHGIPWHYYYAILAGFGFMTGILNIIAFWSHTVTSMRIQEEKDKAIRRAASTKQNESIECSEVTRTPTLQSVSQKSDLRRVFFSPFCLSGAILMFLYLGLEISTGGFIVTYLVRVRNGAEGPMGFANAGFWGGITLGRFILTPLSSYIGLAWANEIYLALALVFELTFWLAQPIAGAAVGVAFLGFFIGPTFPLVMELATKSLDPELHVAGIAFIASFGSIGGALLPFLVGILSTAKGPKVVPYVLTALMSSCLIVWFLLPRPEAQQKHIARLLQARGKRYMSKA